VTVVDKLSRFLKAGDARITSVAEASERKQSPASGVATCISKRPVASGDLLRFVYEAA